MIAQKKLPIRMLLMHVIKNCNSPCVMCDCWKTRRLSQLTIEQIERSASAFAQAGGGLVMVSGGEPLLRKDIQQVLSILKNFGLSISLNTNGLLLNRRFHEVIEYCDSIIISVDAAESELYKSIRGVDGLGVVVNAAQNLLSSGYTNIQFRCTISRLNLFHFPQVIALGEELGIKGVGFSPIDADSSSFARSDEDKSSKETLLPSIIEVELFRQSLRGEIGECIRSAYERGVITWNLQSFQLLADYFMWNRGVESSGDPSPCFFPYSAALVDYDGTVRPCFYTSGYAQAEDLTSDALTSYSNVTALLSQNKCLHCRGHVFT